MVNIPNTNDIDEIATKYSAEPLNSCLSTIVQFSLESGISGSYDTTYEVSRYGYSNFKITLIVLFVMFF